MLYKEQRTDVYIVGILSLFTIRFVLLWCINLFLAILLIAATISWRDECYCDYRCNIIKQKSKNDPPCEPVNSCVGFAPNEIYTCSNYPACVPENPCFQPIPFCDKDYCNNPNRVCENGTFLPSAPQLSDITQNEICKENVPCLYCGRIILGCTDNNHTCQKCQDDRKQYKICGQCRNYKECSSESDCCNDCNKRLKCGDPKMDNCLNHKPCLTCEVKNKPCMHLNATCEGYVSDEYISGRKTHENNFNEFYPKLGKPKLFYNPKKKSNMVNKSKDNESIYCIKETQKTKVCTSPRRKSNIEHKNQDSDDVQSMKETEKTKVYTSPRIKSIMVHKNEDSDDIQSPKETQKCTIDKSPRKSHTFVPTAPNRPFKVLRKFFNSNENM